jgi:hypothetical protein
MATTTSNLGLTKPLGTEQYDVNVFNNNADLVDAEFGATGGHAHTGIAGDGSQISTGGLAAAAVTLAKLAAGLAGNLISYDASGNPAAVATGSAGQVLASNGAGAAPTFQAVAGGTILQLQSTTLTSTVSSTSDTYTDVAGLSVSITPASTSSKILIQVHVSGGVLVSGGAEAVQMQLLRGSTAIAIGDAGGSRTRATFVIAPENADRQDGTASLAHLDSPATTAATTYKIQFRRAAAAGTIYVNRSNNDSDAANHARTVSSITVMEIAA